MKVVEPLVLPSQHIPLEIAREVSGSVDTWVCGEPRDLTGMELSRAPHQLLDGGLPTGRPKAAFLPAARRRLPRRSILPGDAYPSGGCNAASRSPRDVAARSPSCQSPALHRHFTRRCRPSDTSDLHGEENPLHSYCRLASRYWNISI
jgi:hypothetical protein